MSNLYDAALPVFRQTLGAMAGVLDKGEGFAREKGVEADTLLNARLAPDMHPLAFQLAQAVNHSMGAVRKLKGEADVPFIPNYASYAEARKSVAEGVAFLAAVTPADLEGAEGRDVLFKFPGGALRFTGEGYLQSFALPNFYFHATMAYGVLRNQGVPLGKGDFLGPTQVIERIKG
ncbi:DUF1993 domain-containing protein [Phenylobacterium sp.]|jgi:hypothetical protein|uniref:DUF1993 domain-containing protein n=1 Tax=Phenylobacterium sp. TaxID=1871053 RepID=UPI002F3F7882